MPCETVQKWEPVTGIPSKLWWMTSLVDKDGLLRIEIEEDQNKSSWAFTFDHCLSYRNTDEGDRLEFLSELQGQESWSLYTVKNSTYEKWFNRESFSKWEGNQIYHFVFFTQDDLIDVLSFEPPRVERMR